MSVVDLVILKLIQSLEQGGKVLMTIVERKSKLSLIGLSINKTANTVKDVIICLQSALSSSIHTLTYDNGSEFAEHEVIDEVLNTQGYLVHTYASWERDLNENTNSFINPEKSTLTLL